MRIKKRTNSQCIDKTAPVHKASLCVHISELISVQRVSFQKVELASFHDNKFLDLSVTVAICLCYSYWSIK